MTSMLSLLAFILFWFAVPVDPDPIQDIRKKYAQITQAQSAGELNQHEILYDCSDYPEQGQVTFFYNSEDELRLVVRSFDDGSHGGEEISYYVWDEQVFFVYRSGGYWNFVYTGNDEAPSTEDHLYEYRHYFVDEQAIRCLEKEWTNGPSGSQRSEDVPNEEGDCAGSETVVEDFRALLPLQHMEIAPNDCIWDLLD